MKAASRRPPIAVPLTGAPPAPPWASLSASALSKQPQAPDFDPYHKWLGIPPEEQPTNHYRLLGIKLFEDDRDVIDNAADQRMAHLRRFQSGRHGELSQRLLNEVSAARVCLLNPAQKAAYDTALRRVLAALPAERASGPLASLPATEHVPGPDVDSPIFAGFAAKIGTVRVNGYLPTGAAVTPPMLSLPSDAPLQEFLDVIEREETVPHVRVDSRKRASNFRMTTVGAIGYGKGRERPTPFWMTVIAAGGAMVLLGLVVYLATNKGTIKIELNGPKANVEVRIDGAQIDTWRLDEPLRLGAGDHVLAIRGKDIQSVSQSFTVRRGDNAVLRVELRPKKRPPVASAGLAAGYVRCGY